MTIVGSMALLTRLSAEFPDLTLGGLVSALVMSEAAHARGNDDDGALWAAAIAHNDNAFLAALRRVFEAQ